MVCIDVAGCLFVISFGGVDYCAYVPCVGWVCGFLWCSVFWLLLFAYRLSLWVGLLIGPGVWF